MKGRLKKTKKGSDSDSDNDTNIKKSDNKGYANQVKAKGGAGAKGGFKTIKELSEM